jgi:hypothetical protein
VACEQHPVDALEQAIGAYAQRQDVQLSSMAARWRLIRDYDFDRIGKHTRRTVSTQSQSAK